MIKNKNRKFEWVELEKLHSGLAYQRPINEEFIKSAVKNFDSNEVESPCVSLRIKENGEKEYRVVDGQHTITICKCIGWTKIRCEIREGLTEEEEHEWFLVKNTKKRPQTSGRILNAKVQGGFDSDTNKLVKLLDSVGYKIKTVDVINNDGVINAGLTIENIYKNMGDVEFEKFIVLHSNVWNGDKKALTAPFLKGMQLFYITYKDDFEIKRFIQAFLHKSVSANDINKEVSKIELKKDSNFKYAWVLVQYYNKGLSENKKLKFSKLED